MAWLANWSQLITTPSILYITIPCMFHHLMGKNALELSDTKKLLRLCSLMVQVGVALRRTVVCSCHWHCDSLSGSHRQSQTSISTLLRTKLSSWDNWIHIIKTKNIIEPKIKWINGATIEAHSQIIVYELLILAKSILNPEITTINTYDQRSKSE